MYYLGSDVPTSYTWPLSLRCVPYYDYSSVTPLLLILDGSVQINCDTDCSKLTGVGIVMTGFHCYTLLLLNKFHECEEPYRCLRFF